MFYCLNFAFDTGSAASWVAVFDFLEQQQQQQKNVSLKYLINQTDLCRSGGVFFSIRLFLFNFHITAFISCLTLNSYCLSSWQIKLTAGEKKQKNKKAGSARLDSSPGSIRDASESRQRLRKIWRIKCDSAAVTVFVICHSEQTCIQLKQLPFWETWRFQYKHN